MDYWILLVFLIVCAYTFTSATSPALLLTPYLEKNQTELARNLSRVDPAHFLNVTSHSGFLTVDLKKNSNLFFWYFPVADKPVEKTPWIIWLQGGPGATGMSGLFDEIGPFQYDKELKKRDVWWGEEFSLLFFDNPVGAGFSFTDSKNGFVENMDQCSNHLYGAIQQFLEVFPELRGAPLYLAGESYAGHYVPALAEKVLHPPPELAKAGLKDISINLKGLMLGNPVIDRRDHLDHSQLFHTWGLLDTQGVQAARPYQEKYATAVKQGDAAQAYQARNDYLDELLRLSYQFQEYNVLKDQIDLEGFIPFITSPIIREAIHVGDLGFTFSNGTVHEKLLPDFLALASRKIEDLLEHYRILIYCGQLDLSVPCALNSEARRKGWRWSHRDDFLNAPRLPWDFNNTLAGYVKNGGGLTEVLVRNAGHLAPYDRPAETKALISHFINGIDLPLPINFNVKDINTPTYEEETNEPPKAASTPMNSNGVVASAVLNVIFVVVIILGIVYWVRWKRRTETYFYSMIDNSSLNDGILTMN